jgi:hypothetical protein
MSLDLRLPIGLLFTLLGVLLAAYGLASDATAYRSLGINVNAWWGAVMAAFGGLMLGLAWRAARRGRGR